MYDINTKNVKKGKKFYYVFLAAGLLFFIIIGGVLLKSYKNLNSFDSTVTSTRVEVNLHTDDEGTLLYSPTYYFVVDGNEYVCPSRGSSSINPGTENKTVYYDSKDPSNCMTEYSKSGNKFFLLFLLIPIIFILMAVVNLKKINKRVKIINELNQRGKLVKNLPYRLEDTGMSVNNVQIQRPVVNYTLASGSTITLYGDPRHDGKYTDSDGMVDVVIDESNPNNYFIDFSINRLGGNLPSDYFNNIVNNGTQTNNVNYQYSNNVVNNGVDANSVNYQYSNNMVNNGTETNNVNYQYNNVYSGQQQNQVSSQPVYSQANLNQEISQSDIYNQNNNNNN